MLVPKHKYTSNHAMLVQMALKTASPCVLYLSAFYDLIEGNTFPTQLDNINK